MSTIEEAERQIHERNRQELRRLVGWLREHFPAACAQAPPHYTAVDVAITLLTPLLPETPVLVPAETYY